MPKQGISNIWTWQLIWQSIRCDSLGSRHFLSQKRRHFLHNIRSWAKNEFYCMRTVDIPNVYCTNKISSKYFFTVFSCFMMTSSNGNIFLVTGPLCAEFTGPGEFPTQRPVTRSFDVFFDLRLNKWLSKQPWGWWFETPLWSLWRQCYVHTINKHMGKHKAAYLITFQSKHYTNNLDTWTGIGTLANAAPRKQL